MNIHLVLYDYVKESSFIWKQLRIKTFQHLIVDGAPSSWKSYFKIQDNVTSVKIISQSLNQPYLHFLDTKTVELHWPLHLLPKNHDEAAQTLAICYKSFTEKKVFIESSILGDQSSVLRCVDLNSADPTEILLRLVSPNRSSNKVIFHKDFIQKTCSDINKGRSEANFFSDVPEDLKHFFPTLINTSENQTQSSFSYALPRYPLLDLSRHLLHRSLTDTEWKFVFKSLEGYLNSCPALQRQTAAVQEKLRDLFIHKMNTRLLAYLNEIPNKELGILAKEVVQHLEDEIQNCSLSTLTFSHGDLCLSNILLNRDDFSVKLIDPRGILNHQDAYIPIYYDLAKLSQCFRGDYDWIMAQNYRPHWRDEQSLKLQNHFDDLIRNMNIQPKLLLLGEASLFISMLPLHMDQLHLHESLIASAKSALQAAKDLEICL